MVAQQHMAHFMGQHRRDFVLAFYAFQHAERHVEIAVRVG